METYLSIEGLSKYLGIAEKTIRRWVLNRDVPYRKIHKLIRFRVSEIERWIDGGAILLPEEKPENNEGDVLNGAISLDELAAMEEAEEEAGPGAKDD